VALDELEVAGAGVKRLHRSSVSPKTSSDTISAILAHEWRALLLVAADEEQRNGAGDRQRDERGEDRERQAYSAVYSHEEEGHKLEPRHLRLLPQWTLCPIASLCVGSRPQVVPQDRHHAQQQRRA
jgi:hypothetical protein